MDDFEDFARAQLPGLLRYAVMLTGEREQAADLVQDVLVKVYRLWPRVSRADRPERYVVRMVTNQFLSWRRSWAVRYLSSAAEVPERPHPSDVGAEVALRDEMWSRLRGLPRRQRAVLVLRYYQQLTDAEIADVLGCAPATVRGYAHRALAALRADLDSDPRLVAEETR